MTSFAPSEVSDEIRAHAGGKREIGDDPDRGATLHGVVFNILVGSDVNAIESIMLH
jgi:hypothetical protein